MGGAKQKKMRPFGCWPSAITSRRVAEKTLRFQDLLLADGWLYWSEQRPDQNGRTTLMAVNLRAASQVAGEGKNSPAAMEGMAQELLPPSFGMGTRLHEYGGLSFCLTGAGGGSKAGSKAD